MPLRVDHVPILFLDIEGVLCSHDHQREASKLVTKHEDWGKVLDPHCISILNTIVEMHDLEVVVTSSWKHIFPLKLMTNWLRTAGLHAHEHVIGVTPTAKTNSRTMEITHWLVRHRKDPSTRQYVILDDSDVSAHRHRLVRVDPEEGLSESHIGDVARILAIT